MSQNNGHSSFDSQELYDAMEDVVETGTVAAPVIPPAVTPVVTANQLPDTITPADQNTAEMRDLLQEVPTTQDLKAAHTGQPVLNRSNATLSLAPRPPSTPSVSSSAARLTQVPGAPRKAKGSNRLPPVRLDAMELDRFSSYLRKCQNGKLVVIRQAMDYLARDVRKKINRLGQPGKDGVFRQERVPGHFQAIKSFMERICNTVVDLLDASDEDESEGEDD